MTSDPAQAGWRPAPAQPVLGRDEVHVWRIALQAPAEHVERVAALLDADERERAARFHFERDRTAFVVARGALRVLVGGYVAEAPEHLVFGYRERGKPYLEKPAGALRFNLAHSGEVGLLAFSRDRELGVDVEQRRPLDDLRSLARVSFSANECAALLDVPPHDQLDAFFACWARKEALIKATGEGVSQLAGFDVSLRPGEPARLLSEPDRARWSLFDLPGIPGYAAALVVENPAVRIACWDGRG